MELLLSAARAAGEWDADRVEKELSGTTGYTGITGEIGIDPKTGNRQVVPVLILDIDPEGADVVDPKWAKFAGVSL